MSHRKIYSVMQDIGTQSIWMGLLPTGLVDMQQQYYSLNGHKRTGKGWGKQLVGKLLRATHHLWLHRNSMLHMKAENGLSGLALADLHEAAQEEFRSGTTDMNSWDWYLMDTTLQDVLADTEEGIRSWLCEVHIARGKIDQAIEEQGKDRRIGGMASTRISATQRKQFLDWRKVKLSG